MASNTWMPVDPEAPSRQFSEHVVAPQDREAQWTRIKDAGADGRHCNVYDSPEDHAKWMAMFSRCGEGGR